MAANFEQLEMLTRRAVKLSVETQEELARRCIDRHDALIQCFRQSGLDPKQVYGQLEGVSQTQFSLFLSRKANLPHKQEHKFMRVCGNEIPLRYDAWKFDQQLKPIRTDLESRVEDLEQKLADRDRAIQILGEMLRGGR